MLSPRRGYGSNFFGFGSKNPRACRTRRKQEDVQREPARSFPPSSIPAKRFFLHTSIFFSPDRGSFLVLSAPRHAGSPPVLHGASVGPGRGPWHVLWGFKVAEKLASNHGDHEEPPRRMQTHMVKKHVPQVSRTDCLATSGSCSSALVLVFVLSCSCSCSSALVLVLAV